MIFSSAGESTWLSRESASEEAIPVFGDWRGGSMNQI